MRRLLVGGLVLAVLAIVVLAGCAGEKVTTTTTTAAALEPITSIPLNTDDDPMITVAELKASYVRMHEIVSIIAKHDAAVAAALDAKVAALEDTLENHPQHVDINTSGVTASEILTAYEALRTSK